MPLSLTIDLGLAALTEELIELASDADAGDRGVSDQRQALARAVVDYDQDAHPAAVDELIGDGRSATVGPASAPACPRPACVHRADEP